jgi:hypothetical protein
MVNHLFVISLKSLIGLIYLISLLHLFNKNYQELKSSTWNTQENIITQEADFKDIDFNIKNTYLSYGSVVICAEFGREDRGSIHRNCDQEGVETT